MLLWFPLPNMEGVDESEYIALGQNLRLHHIFSFGAPHAWGTAWRVECYGTFRSNGSAASALFAAHRHPVGGDAPPYLALALAQVRLGALIALLVYLVALRALGLPVAIVAGMGMALAPESASYVMVALTETLYTFLVIAFLWLWGKKRGLLAGLVLGAAALIRSTALVLVPLILLMGLVWGFNRTIHLNIALGALLAIGPWVARNFANSARVHPHRDLWVGFRAVLFHGECALPQWKSLYGLACRQRIRGHLCGREPLHSKLPSAAFVEAAVQRITNYPLGYLWNRVTEYPRNFLDHGASYMPLIPLPELIVKSGSWRRASSSSRCSFAAFTWPARSGDARTSSLWCLLLLRACTLRRGQPTLQHSAGASPARLRRSGCLPCLDACGEACGLSAPLGMTVRRDRPTR